MLIFYLHSWCKGSIWKKQVCILRPGVSLCRHPIFKASNSSKDAMRFVTQMQCSAKSRILYPFFHNGQNFQNPTPFQCHILHFNVAKFWISTSVVANGQFQSCTVQSWGCDWSGFKKDPLQDTQGLRATGHLRWGILSVFGHRNCARFQLFCLHDIADIHLYSMDIVTLGLWVFFDVVYFGSGLIWYTRILSNQFSWTCIA